MKPFDITSLKLNNLQSFEYKCACGAEHKFATQRLVFEENGIAALSGILTELIFTGKTLIISAEDVYLKFARKVTENLTLMNFKYSTYIFESNFIPREEHIGDLKPVSEDCRAVIALGSGSICDISKYFAYIYNLPLIVIATAPSCDAYLSPLSTLYKDNIKKTFTAKAPEAVICDSNIYCDCPNVMVASGFGDMAGKLTALIDYRVYAVFKRKNVCANLYNFSRIILKAGLNCGSKLITNEGKILLMQTLMYSSLIMQLMGSSLLASGGEHQVAHVLEMMRHRDNKPNLLHGEAVFLSFLQTVKAYKLFFGNKIFYMGNFPNYALKAEQLDNFFDIPENEYLKSVVCDTPSSLRLKEEMLKKLSGVFNNEIDGILTIIPRLKLMFTLANGSNIFGFYSDEEYQKAFYFCPEIKDKYTSISLMRDLGLLEGLVES